jgi:hypothetical protein
VKLNSLRQLVKEELKRALNENISLKDKYPAGTYDIEYITSHKGEPDNEASDTVTIDADETYTNPFGEEYSEENFWIEKLEKKYGYLKFPIYKITNVTKVG